MKVELKLDPGCGAPRVTVTAPALTEEVRALLRRLEGDAPTFTAWREGRPVPLLRREILRFYGEDKGVRCQAEGGTYDVRERLYELEEQFAGTRFVRVSNSEMVNLDQVTALDLTLSGTIKMTLAADTVCYVSRRYVKKIKEALTG